MKINLKVINPCPVRLSRMEKDCDTFFCNSCTKKVIDFRGKTYEEIVRMSDKDTCGIFTEDQLPGQQRLGTLRQTIFYGLAILSFLGFNVKPLSAQTSDTTKTQMEPVEISQKDRKEKMPASDKVSKPITVERHKCLLRKRGKKRRITGCPEF